MTFLPGRLGSLLARNLMSTELLILTEDLTVDDASEKLRKHRHSGAPVVDSEGILVGTFSVRDIVRTKRERPKEPSKQDLRNELAAGSGSWLLMDQVDEIPDAPVETVKKRMRREPPFVNEKDTLIQVARLMCDHHMHRVPVVKSGMKLVGIISTMDVLAALVHTADESETFYS